MSNTNALQTGSVLRKSAQEVEIDHLLAEEFNCDPSFAERFVTACGLSCAGFQVSAAIPEPSLGGEGFGDLLVDGTADGLKVAFLIEDKITAGPAVRQAERYAAHANWLRDQGWDRVWTVLVAPSSYCGERSGYDVSVDLEKVATILRSPEPTRLAYRRGIIERALEKKASTGVRVPDTAMYRLKAAYFRTRRTGVTQKPLLWIFQCFVKAITMEIVGLSRSEARHCLPMFFCDIASGLRPKLRAASSTSSSHPLPRLSRAVCGDVTPLAHIWRLLERQGI